MSSDATRLRGSTQTRAYEIFRYRRGAVLEGLRDAGVVLGVTLGFAVYVAIKFEAYPDSPAFWYVVIGGPTLVFLPMGFWFWWRRRHEDAIHRQFQQAPGLPVRQLREHDDAWIEGRIRCPRPRRARNHRHRCAWYHLTIEEWRSTGKRSEWVTVLDQTHRTRCWITDATREIEIHVGNASIDYPITTTRKRGNRRFTLRYLPATGRISACGVVRYRNDVVTERQAERRGAKEEPEAQAIDTIAARSPEKPEEDLPRTKSFKAWHPKHARSQVREEKKAMPTPRRRRRHLREVNQQRRAKGAKARQRERRLISKRAPTNDWHLKSIDEAHGVPADRRLLLTSHRHVPLMVTPLGRAQWHDRAEADELSTGIRGDVLLACGIPAFTWTLGCLLGWWALAWLPGAPIGAITMLAVLLPSKVIGRYNRFVVYRRRIPNARAYLDADLKMRANLLPQLVAVVKGYAAHEQGVLSRLTNVRKVAQAGEDTTRSLKLLREAYPDLKARGNFDQLFTDVLALEEKIAFGRALLRDSITEYNDTVQSFPSNVLAALTGFKAEPLPGRGTGSST